MTNPNYLYKNNMLTLKKIMRQNIKNNRDKSIKAKLYHGRYYDFTLFNGKVTKFSEEYINSLAIADFSSLNIENGILYSDTTWNNAINEDVKLLDIGLTGMDNGLISFRKDRVTNEEFLNLFLNSEFTIKPNDTRFFMTPITGNTLNYIYPMYLNEVNERYIACKGGFYQGFFKLFGHKYQVLPDNLENDIVLQFNIRPRSDYETDEYTINYTHPNNKGIFFFIGTRAENKFWPFFKPNTTIFDKFKKIHAQNEGYFSGCNNSGDTYNINENNIIFLENEWVKEEDNKITPEGYFALGDDYFSINDSFLKKEILKIDKNQFITDKCCCNDYFIDSYYDNKCPKYDNNKFVEEDFIGYGAMINKDYYYMDSFGHEINKTGHLDIETDNKFLIFDRTPSGFTTNNWIEGSKMILSSRRNWPNANYFVLMNRTKTGFTAHNIVNYNEKNSYDYNLYKDIRNNVFALRITDKGEIGYRYGMLDCNSENKYKIVEEYSKENIIKYNDWNKINVRFTSTLTNKMKIFIYVNSNLIFVSKELEIFNFRELSEIYQKQETVPFNISLGGGSLGLLETILPNYYAVSDYILPIERDFCGTFIGDIKSFKIYEGFIDYSAISNYLS